MSSDPLFLIRTNILRLILIEIARRRQTITYGILMTQLGVNRFQLKALLEEVVRLDWVNEAPLLASLVVAKHTGVPGDGFVQYVTAKFKDDIAAGQGICLDIPPEDYSWAHVLGGTLIDFWSGRAASDPDCDELFEKHVVDFFQTACFKFYGGKS